MKYLIVLFSIISINNIGSSQSNFIISDGNVVVNNGSKIVLDNTNLTNDGNLSAGDGEVKITGDAATQIGGNSITTFNNISLENTAADLTLTNDIEVGGTLDLKDSHIQTGTNDIVINAGGQITHALGYIKTTSTGAVYQEVGNNEVNFPIGNTTYTPLAMSNAGTTGYISVRTSRGVLDGGNSGSEVTSEVVDVTWHLTETSNDPKDLTVTATWNAAEEASDFDRDNAFIWHYTNGSWSETTTKPASGSDPYSISRSGITDISQLSVASGTALPLQLLSIAAIPVANDIQVNWITTNEINTDHFIVEHATENAKFSPIGRVKAAGNSTRELDYSFLHTHPAKGINYYRLLQMDRDGKFSYSPIVQVEMNAERLLQAIKVFPNP
ncbi:MAG: hypothetical protein AB8G22_28965, partial [Saprospiraceae bacterium]